MKVCIASTLDRQRRIFALLADVVTLDEIERDAALARADVEIAGQVRELLAADATDDGLLSPAQLADSFSSAEPLLEPGQSVGPYRLVEVLGVGGMGAVYLAEQREPVDRRVALKILRVQLDHSEAQQRFDSERHAMGRLEHPNVAKILDAGVTPDGLPYLAMELIDGEPITAYCDRLALSLEERLRLFLQVCRGVDHAHHKFLLHRDIKPSNVLVTEIDGRPVPKLIDFGIVKGLDGSLIEDPMLTGQRVLGTPHYMSPEALGLGGELDTRSDVFSLGVLLYELLAGRLPWGGAETGLAVLIHRRLDDDYAAPATLLAGLPAEEARRLGARRGIPTAGWFQQLRGDLDAIVTKAIARRPEERYDSARNLADDVERHLEHQPVTARRARGLYVVRKLVRRHRSLFALIAALLLGTVGTTLGLLEAQRQTRVALAERDGAEELSEFLTALLNDARPGRGTAGLSAEELLARGSRLLETELEGDPHRRARLQATLGNVYLNWGLLDPAVPLVEAALRVQDDGSPRTEAIRSLTTLARLRYKKGQPKEARALAERALRLADQLPRLEVQPVAILKIYLGDILRELDELENAEALYRRALALLEQDQLSEPLQLSLAYSGLGEVSKARRSYERAATFFLKQLDLLETEYGPEDYRVAVALAKLGKVYYRQRRYDDAESMHRRALSIKEKIFGVDSPELASATINLGNVMRRAARYDEAEALYLRSLELLRLHRSGSRDHSAVLQNLGHMLAFMVGRPKEGRRHLLEALAVKEAIGGENGQLLVTTLSSLGSLELKEGRPEACEAYFRRVLAIQETLENPDPSKTGRAWLDIGLSMQARGRLTEARVALERSMVIYRELERDDGVAAVQTALDELASES